MPCVIHFLTDVFKNNSFILLQNTMFYIQNGYENCIFFREIAKNSNVIKFGFKTVESCLKAFNFLMELMRTNPPVIVDTKKLVEDTDNYIDYFYEKKNQ
jgi:hypothetical protein